MTFLFFSNLYSQSAEYKKKEKLFYESNGASHLYVFRFWILLIVFSNWHCIVSFQPLMIAFEHIFSHFYCAMHVVLARYCYRKSSVCPSVRL